MKRVIAVGIMLLAAYNYADDDKVSVNITENGFSTSGGFGREKALTVTIEKSFANETLTVDQKIWALQDRLCFYKLVKQHNIDLGMKVTVAYADEPLKPVLAKLLPGINVTFQGVKEDVTIGSMTAVKTDVEKVCNYLGEACGVYFHFTEQGLIVTSESPWKTEPNKAAQTIGSEASPRSGR